MPLTRDLKCRMITASAGGVSTIAKEAFMEQNLAQLITLLPQLRAGEIAAIEFGHSNDPMGFMSHHRVMRINTPAGSKFAVKEVARGMLGSGNYLGDCDDEAIIKKCTTMLERYYRPSANPVIRAYMESHGKVRQAPEYFAIAHMADHAA